MDPGLVLTSTPRHLGGLLQARGAVPVRTAALLLAEALVLALVLALAWGALRTAREAQADALAVKARRVEVKLGLATAAFFALVWWVALFRTKTVTDSADLGAWAVLGASAWGAWMTYRFFWARSRDLGNRDSGARSTGLTSLLYFCLPGLAFFLADGLSWFILSGRDPRPPVWRSMAYGIPVGVLLPTLAALLWAAGKVSLVSIRERSGLSRAVLSLLGLLCWERGSRIRYFR